MKRPIMPLITLSVVFMIAMIVQALNSFGTWGYPYRLNKTPGTATSQYNIWGRVEYIETNTKSRFQTFGLRIAGPQVTLQILRLKGRVWWKGESNHCQIQSSGHKDWYNTYGEFNNWVLDLGNPDLDVWGSYSVGRHRLVHPSAVSTLGVSPKRFFVKSAPTPSSNLDEWNGYYPTLGCMNPLSGPAATDDPDS